jgi:cyclic pyranopterin phosphate synthase
MDAAPRLTHVDEAGAARMVDVSAKEPTDRVATAGGRLLVSPAVVALLRGTGVPKGDALGTARIAGIMGAKRTADLVPLCHPLPISGVTVDLTVADDAVEIVATVRTTGRTGVEMEALTAVAVAGLTLHDMVKAVDPAAELTRVRLLAKSGGRSGEWRRAEQGEPAAQKAGPEAETAGLAGSGAEGSGPAGAEAAKPKPGTGSGAEAAGLAGPGAEKGELGAGSSAEEAGPAAGEAKLGAGPGEPGAALGRELP